MYQTDDFETGLELIRKDCKLAAITRSERGSVVVSGDVTVSVPAIAIEELVDTTGAGDLYAAGLSVWLYQWPVIDRLCKTWLADS